MDRKEQLLKTKVDAAVARCRALDDFLVEVRSTARGTDAATAIIDAVDSAADSLGSYLASLPEKPGLNLLTISELETKINLRTEILPILHAILGLIERSEVGGARPELLASLRRRVQRHFPQGEILLVRKLHLNYSITELSDDLESIFDDAGLSLPADFPRPLFLATLPAIEHEDALLHCILSHEIGHTLYEHQSLEDDILPVEIDQDYLTEIYEKLESSLPDLVEDEDEAEEIQQELPFNEIAFRESVTSRVHSTIINWIEELASDVYGVLTYGPALIYSFIYFTVAFERLDAGSISHPPPRLRLQLQFRVWDSLYEDVDLADDTEQFLANWRSIIQDEPDTTDLFSHLALYSINDQVLSRIVESVKKALDKEMIYTGDRYKVAVEKLVPLLCAHVPPGESLEAGDYALNSPVDILNAGWETFISYFDQFSDGLPENSDQWADVQLNRIITKALELQEARIAWEEARDAVDDE